MIFVDTVSLEALRGGSVEVFMAAPAAVRCKLMIFDAIVSLEALRGGSVKVFTSAPAAVGCKLMIFVATVSLEALRGGSVEVFTAAPAAVRCKLDTRLDTLHQLLQDNQFRNWFLTRVIFLHFPLWQIAARRSCSIYKSVLDSECCIN
jgi:hypothetical protein